MATLQELLAQREELNEKIKTLVDTGRTEAIAKVKVLMQTHGLSLADLRSSSSGAEKSKSDPAKKAPAKYRDDAGNSWSGRGLQPRWMRAAIESGKTREDFAI